uniref:Uncharacterized protein n=1 Tax=Arundo donax TaxID=35708 RepID=A0A0A9C774_ARUDO
MYCCMDKRTWERKVSHFRGNNQSCTCSRQNTLADSWGQTAWQIENMYSNKHVKKKY